MDLSPKSPSKTSPSHQAGFWARGWRRLRGWFARIDFGNSIVIYRVHERAEGEASDEIDILAYDSGAIDITGFREAVSSTGAADTLALETAEVATQSVELTVAGNRAARRVGLEDPTATMPPS